VAVRDTSTAARAQLYAQHATQAFLHLVTIDHDDLAAPIRVTDNLTDIVSNGVTFTAFPMRVVLPPDVPAEMPQVDLIIDAVDRSIITAVRSIATPPSVTINVIMASTPDVIECGPLMYEAIGVDYNATEVRLRLEVERILSEPYPCNLFTPSNAPLLFQAVAA
jgi:hypothetical protein